MVEKQITKRVSEVDGKCINFNDEFRCPGCRALLVPVCVNLGRIRVGKEEEKLYCSRNFPADCSQYGCPKYSYVGWLEGYRNTGRLETITDQEHRRSRKIRA